MVREARLLNKLKKEITIKEREDPGSEEINGYPETEGEK